MKRLFIIIFISLSAFATANAQSANSTHYRDLKGSYNFKEYEKQATDPYNAGWYECASFFVPGVGQLLSGEVGRGIAFIAGEAILMSIVAETASTIKEIAITNDKGFLIGYTDEKKRKDKYGSNAQRPWSRSWACNLVKHRRQQNSESKEYVLPGSHWQ